MGALSFLLMAVVLSCHFCGGNATFSEDADYTKHMFAYHKTRPDFAMYCGYPGCRLRFKNYKTRMSHKKIHVIEVPRIPEDPENLCNSNNDLTTSDPPLESPPPRSESLPDSDGPVEHDLNEHDFHVGQPKISKEFLQAQFLLSLRAKNLPANVIESVMEATQTIVESSVEDFASQIERHLRNKNIDYSDLDINNLKKESSECFVGLKSKWLQDKYFAENMDMILPKKILLDASVCKNVGKESSNPKTPIKHDSFHYISLLDSLKNLCSNENFLDLLKPLTPSSDSIVRGCFDGSLFQENPILANNPDALAVVLYYDEVNLVDTASSRPVKYGMFYYTVLNISEEHRSGLHAINLLMAVDCNLIKEYGINQFVSVIVKDLLLLEEGLELPNGNIVYGSLLALMGDNLASHMLGGFKQGFTAYRICRYCFAIIQDVQCMCVEDVNLLRSPGQYDAQVKVLKSLENNQAQLSKKSTEFGLNHGSALNDLPHFHVTKNLSPDPFHDLLEGSWALTIRRVLQRFCLGPNKVISLKDLNFRICEMDYGYSETRPTTVSEQHLADNAGLHQTGSQMWSLVNILPLIVEPLVDADDEHWLNYLCLLKITALVFAHSISKGEIGYLAELVEEYVTSFQHLYRHLTPKQHFLIHYPRLITLFGPLSIYSTMRMEGKHQYFKDLMSKAKCYKNPSLTMAKQHQLYQIHKFSGEVARIAVFGPIKTIFSSSAPFSHLLPKDTLIQTSSWYCAEGVTYKPNLCCCIVGLRDFLPQFGSLVGILINTNGEAVFVLKAVKTVAFDVFKNMYQVEVTDKYSLVKFSALEFKGVYHLHHLGDQGAFIVVKRFFPGLL